MADSLMKGHPTLSIKDTHLWSLIYPATKTAITFIPPVVAADIEAPALPTMVM